MIDQVASGPVLALRIVSPTNECPHGNDSLVEAFRELVGPLNAELASKIRPKSLRAKFGCTEPGGMSLSHNAVHCTDLAEDGEMECRYFFGTLASM